MHDDAELLRRYAEDQDEAAFAELVRRHVNLVHSAALRQVNGDAHLAADVTQVVFTDLARKAAALASHRVLAGWLFTSTRYAAAKAVRTERRRAAREQEAQLMPDDDSTARLDWARVRPVLDAALGELKEGDRAAILLRFFEGRDFADVGARLHVSDNAARMRVDRALDKLRALLARRGVASTTGALAAALGAEAVIAAPAGLATAVTGAALSGAAGVTGVAATFMSMTKLQVVLAAAIVATGTTGLVVQARANRELRDEAAGLRQQNDALAALQTENAALQRTTAELRDLRGDDAELKRLGEEATSLKAGLQQVERAERQAAAAAPNAEGTFNISQLDAQPRPRSQARPQYPFELRRAGVTGTVVVDFVVDRNGDVQNAHAVKSSIDEKPANVVRMGSFAVAADGQTTGTAATPETVQQFEVAAVEAVQKWKFTAGLKGGREVNTHLQVPIAFSLGNGNAAATSPKN